MLNFKKGSIFARSAKPEEEWEQATELIACLRGIAPYVIIDCGSYIANDILSAIALMESDAVLRLVNGDLKSISYLSSQLPLLRDNKWDADKQYKVASNIKPNEEPNVFTLNGRQRLEKNPLPAGQSVIYSE